LVRGDRCRFRRSVAGRWGWSVARAGLDDGAARLRRKLEGAGGEAGVGWGVAVGGSRILPGGVVM